MDGGGRLVLSQRSPSPRNDLMDALAGVAAALRARLPFVSSFANGRRRNHQSSRLIAFVEQRLPRRAGLAATLTLLTTSGGLGVGKGGHLEQFLAGVSEARNAIANSAGFRITSVAIKGRQQLAPR